MGSHAAAQNRRGNGEGHLVLIRCHCHTSPSSTPHQDTASFPPQTQAGVSPVHKGEHLQLRKSLRAEFSFAYMGMGLRRLFCATYHGKIWVDATTRWPFTYAYVGVSNYAYFKPIIKFNNLAYSL